MWVYHKHIHYTHTWHTHATQTYQSYPKTCRNDRNQLNFTPKYKCIIIMSNVNPLNMKLQRHWIVEAIWFSEISVAVLSRQFHYPGSWKEVLLWLWSVAHDILGSRNCNWCPSLATLWWVAGLTGRSWDSLLCSGTNWCVLVLTGVFRDSLVCPGTHWCVLGLSVVSWDSLVCPGTLWHVLDSLMCSGSLWCFLGLIGVSWDSLVCAGTP